MHKKKRRRRRGGRDFSFGACWICCSTEMAFRLNGAGARASSHHIHQRRVEEKREKKKGRQHAPAVPADCTRLDMGKGLAAAAAGKRLDRHIFIRLCK